MKTNVQWIKLAFIVSSVAKCFTLKTIDMHTGLDSNGRLTDTPACCSGEMILLKSYNYEYRECQFIDDCKVSNKQSFLPEEQLLLHQMCSLREDCRNLSIPLRDNLQRNTINAINIKYECIESPTNVVDICESQDRHFHNTIYLTAAAKASHAFCHCMVNDGEFLLSSHDIRLKDIAKDNCPLATLHINTRVYDCDRNRGDKPYKRRMSNAYISLRFNSNHTEPEMVLFTVKPKESVSIMCKGNPSTSTSGKNGPTWTTKHRLITSSSASASTEKTEAGERQSCGRNVEFIIISICVLPVSSACFLALVFCCIRGCRSTWNYLREIYTR